MRSPDSTDVVCLYVATVGYSGASTSRLYLDVAAVLRYDLSLFRDILNELVRQGLFSLSNNFVQLTDKGREMHDEIAVILYGRTAKVEGAR